MYTTTFVETPLSDLLTRVQTLKHDGIRFVQMCAEKDSQDNIDLLYTFYDETMENALNLVVPLKPGDKVPSIQEMYFAAFSYENETHDLYGVRFINMKLDFGGHFFNLAAESPMTIISPEQKAAREKAKKVAAAKAAHADSFIRRLPDGYDTVIAEDGGNISQGQKQLLCIARVMLCLPPMLILDEATSSIDTRTEVRIQKAFARMMQGRTSFIVAHRLSTIREADVILVMKDGHIVEQGNHDELLAAGGFYAKLYNSQFEGVET